MLRILKKVIFLIVIFLIFIILLAIAINIAPIKVAKRTSDWRRKVTESTNSSKPPYHRLKPGSVGIYHGLFKEVSPIEIRINSLGFRDRERNPAKRPNSYRIICVGDSFTFGEGVVLEDTYPSQLESMLTRAGFQNVEVWNAGVSGYNMADYLGYLKTTILRYKPDLIILQFCGDDSIPPVKRSSLIQNTSNRFRNLSPKLRALKHTAKEVLPNRLAIESFKSNYREFLSLCISNNIAVVVWVQSFPKGAEKEVIKISEEFHVPHIYLRDLHLYQLPGDPHLNPEGNRIVAERLLQELLPILKKQPIGVSQ